MIDLTFVLWEFKLSFKQERSEMKLDVVYLFLILSNGAFHLIDGRGKEIRNGRGRQRQRFPMVRKMLRGGGGRSNLRYI